MKTRAKKCKNKWSRATYKMIHKRKKYKGEIILKESTCEARKNIFYFTSKSLFVLEITKL